MLGGSGEWYGLVGYLGVKFVLRFNIDRVRHFRLKGGDVVIGNEERRCRELLILPAWPGASASIF